MDDSNKSIYHSERPLKSAKASRLNRDFNSSMVVQKTYKRKNAIYQMSKHVYMNAGKKVSVCDYFTILEIKRKIKRISVIQGIIEIIYLAVVILDHQFYAICSGDEKCPRPLHLKNYSISNLVLRIIAWLISAVIFYILYLRYTYNKERLIKLDDNRGSNILLKLK
jgi:hypothetical protein